MVSHFENLRVSKRSTKKHEEELVEFVFIFRVISWIALARQKKHDTKSDSATTYNTSLIGLSIRQRHATDRAFADTPKIEHALVFDHVGNLAEALR